MKLVSKIGCPCGFKTGVRYVRPGFLSQVTGSFTCDGCESKLQFIIRRSKGATAKSGKIDIGTNVLDVSDALADLVAEDPTLMEMATRRLSESQ